MPKKAFLCHSSEDKDYVRRIAARLGRAKVIFDEITFATGVDLRKSIRDHLDKASVFVFIASAKSLSSTWCKFELDEAELKSMEGGIAGQLTFVIDPNVTISSIPQWLRKSKVLFQPRAAQASREIERHVLSLLAPEVRQPLMGRENDSLRFSEGVAPASLPSPRILISRGLAGVGRRSFHERAISDYLSLPVGPYLEITNSSGLDDLFMFLVDEVREPIDRFAAAKELDEFNHTDDNKQCDEVAILLAEVCKGRTVPCLVDEGAMLTPEGSYLPIWEQILSKFLERTDDYYLAIVHTRRPHLQPKFEGSYLDSHVGPLDDRVMEQLLSLMLRRERLAATDEQIREIAEYLGGYPPAARFALALVRRYGVDVVLADKRELEDFKAQRFLRFLEESIELDSDQWMILTYLGGERGLPFQALKLALDLDDVVLGAHLKVLMDLSLIRLDGPNYLASAPVLSALYRVKPLPSKEFYARVAARLDKAYWADNNATPPFAVIDASLHATAMGGKMTDSAVTPFIRISTMHRAAQDSYNRDDYASALGYARRAQDLGASGTDVRDRQVRETAYKSLIKMRKWGDAESELSVIEEKNDKRFYFLKGFGQRHQGKLVDAISSYRSALRVGDNRSSVHRELAFCLMRTGKYDDAINACKEALLKHPGNLYVLDTLVLSYLGRRNNKKAKDALDELETVDSSRKFYHHRRASYFAATKQYERALEEADVATSEGRGRFEAFGQRVNILIDLGRFSDARQALETLGKQFPRSRGDVVTGLRCKSEIRQGRWREAETLWRSLEQQNLPVHQALLKNLLLLKSEDGTVSRSTREHAKEAAERIDLDIADFDNAMSILTLSDEEVSGILDVDSE